jgi:type IV pilus assembly protein PilQ
VFGVGEVVKKTTFLSAALLVGALLAPSVPAQVPSREARVNLRSAGQPLDDVVTFLAERSGVNIVVIDRPEAQDPLSGEEVTIELTDVPWRDALDLVAEKVGGVVEERAGGVLALVRPQRVTFEFADADVRKIIETIAKSSNANIVVGPEVTGLLTVRFDDVPWRDALDVVARTLGYTVVQEKRGVLRVVDPLSLQDQLETRTYQLRYLRPKSMYRPRIKSEFVQDMAGQQQQQQQGAGGGVDYFKTFTVLQALSKALSPAGQIDYVDLQNMIIVRDTTQVHDALVAMLERLDVPPLQVFCDVKFVSTNKSDLLDLGVDYGDAGPTIALNGGQIPITFPFSEGKGGWEDYIIASPDGYGPYVDPARNAGATIVPDTVFGALSFQNFAATLRILQRDTRSEVIQAPKVVAIDGRETTIFVGETIRYAEAKSEQGQAGGLQLSVAEASGSPVEVGFQLMIRPNVVPGSQQILMDIIPKETSLSGTSQDSALAPSGFDVFTIGASGLEGSIALPRTRHSTIVTSMMLDSGQTAVIGGLTTEIDSKTTSKVPFIGDIPILGELFKYRTKNRDRRNLMVFVTPSIVHTNADAERILQQELRRRHTALKAELEALVTPDAGAAGGMH